MKSFKKIFLACCVVFALASFLNPLFSLAAPEDALNKLQQVGGEAYGVGAGEEPRSLPDIIGGIIKTALSILGVVAALLIIYAGYIWMTARGKEERVTKAKETLEAAIIGLIIIMAAYAITYFVVDRLMQASSSPTVTPSP